MNHQLHLIDYRNPVEVQSQLENPVRIAAWNLERCKDLAGAVAILRNLDAQIVCLSEMDWGMARSGNRHTVAELAGALGFSYSFGIEFIEEGHGNQTELQRFADQRNEVGWHGNAIISCAVQSQTDIVRLGDAADWRGLDWHSDRQGGRMALCCRVETCGGPLLVVSSHLESLPGAARRAQQIETIIKHIDAVYGRLPVILAGDMNTSELPAGTSAADERPDWFFHPGSFEPLFDVLDKNGFGWVFANTPQHTRRALANGFPKPPFKRLDWIFTRDVVTSSPQVVPAMRVDHAPVSDHELVVVDLEVRPLD